MVAEEDQPQQQQSSGGPRMQMVWKQTDKQRARARPLLPPKAFTSADDDDDDDEEQREEQERQHVAGFPAATDVNDDRRPAEEGVDGEQSRGTETSGRTEFPPPRARETRQELEQTQQAERFWALGNSLAEEGKFGEALGKWETAIYLRPGKAVLHEQKAQVLLEIGKSWSAVQAATCATELQPTWVEAWVTLARAQLNYGEPRLAVESAQTALRLEPDHREANLELERAQFLATRQRQIVNESVAELQLDGQGNLPSSRRARVYDAQDYSFGAEHQIPDIPIEPSSESREDENFDKYDDDTYDWLDDLKRPAPEITTENLMSDFSDIL